MAANPKRKPVADAPSAPAIPQETAEDAARKAEHAQLRLSIRAARAKARQRWEETKNPASRNNQIEVSLQNEHNGGQETTSLPHVDKATLVAQISAVLPNENIAEQDAQALTQLVSITRQNPQAALAAVQLATQAVPKRVARPSVPEQASIALSELAELAVDDPPLFAAKLAAAEKVQAVTPKGRPFTLSHTQQEEIRRRRQEAGEPLAVLAKEFGVDKATISRVGRGVSRAKAGDNSHLP